MSQLGNYIRDRRLAFGLTQEELGQRAGFKWDRQDVSKFETGRSRPNAEARRALAKALGLRHVDLLVAAGELLPEEVPDGQAVAPPSEVERLFQSLSPVSQQAILDDVRDLVRIEKRRARRATEAQEHADRPASTGPIRSTGSQMAPGTGRARVGSPTGTRPQ